jgi:hypothetical protein
MNVRQWVIDALDKSTIADPHAVADDLIDTLTDEEVFEVLQQVLPHYVTTIATQQRSRHLSDAAQPTANNASPRWQAATSIYMERIHTSDGWKMLRDCTRDDLEAAANDRYQRAAQLRQSADRYRALADYLDQQGVSKVGDLPEEDVVRVMSL